VQWCTLCQTHGTHKKENARMEQREVTFGNFFFFSKNSKLQAPRTEQRQVTFRIFLNPKLQAPRMVKFVFKQIFFRFQLKKPKNSGGLP
jgi:hypothetical protein